MGDLHCELCYKNLANLSIALRQLHYDQHFAETDKPAPSSSSPKRLKKPKFFKENDVFWYPTQHSSPPNNYTPGLIPVLRKALLAAHSKGGLHKAALCFPQAIHIQHELWDAGWGCGYRNFLIACACLMVHPFQPMYFPLIDAPIPPSVRGLQQWIEDAWESGFDEEGKVQLKKLVGTRKWIGTSDLYAAFSSRGIPAELVDFRDARDVQIVIDWIVNYFTPPESRSARNAFEELRGASPVICTEKPPLILQHSGHSRTVIGYTVTKAGETHLLTFDSGSCLSKEIRQAALAAFRSSKPVSSSSKRKSDDEDDPPGKFKKQRPTVDSDVEIVAGPSTSTKGVDDDIVFVGATSPRKKTNKATPPVEHRTILKHFTLSPKKLEKNKSYQILYFPMTEPLSPSAMRQRKIVTSTRIC